MKYTEAKTYLSILIGLTTMLYSCNQYQNGITEKQEKVELQDVKVEKKEAFPVIKEGIKTAQNSPLTYRSFTSEEQIPEMLRSFYIEYITIVSSESGVEKLDNLKNAYVTPGLIESINNQFQEGELDYDPFINAQDSDIGSLKTLSIEKKGKSIYTISYVDDYSKEKVNIKLGVVKEDNSFKIGSIL